MRAQRRPGHQPRRHAKRLAWTPLGVAVRAQRRPGHQPRRHCATLQPRHRLGLVDGAQRRPGHQPRRHPAAGAALNVMGARHAQRRPGHQPRRHGRGDPVAGVFQGVEDRSTKAGASTPATLESVLEKLQSLPPRERRSTKAGASTPATRVDVRSRTSAQEFSTAQRRPGHQPRRHPRSRTIPDTGRNARTLNEGRGINPGDTLPEHAQ